MGARHAADLNWADALTSGATATKVPVAGIDGLPPPGRTCRGRELAQGCWSTLVVTWKKRLPKTCELALRVQIP
jgi:hypothetical protein